MFNLFNNNQSTITLLQELEQVDQKIRQDVRQEGKNFALARHNSADGKKPTIKDIEKSYQLLDKNLDSNGYETIDVEEDALNEKGFQLRHNYFRIHAQKYLNALEKALREVKDHVINKGVDPQVANFNRLSDSKVNNTDPYRAEYIHKLQEEQKDLHKDEFALKSLPIYILFALLLCTGDLLMGEYLATQVLQMGEHWWAGPALGIFCIALGVTMEIVLSVIHKASKILFYLLLSSSLVFTLAMFVAMGALRSTQFLELIKPGTTFENWSVLLFFVGMTTAAPTSLGAVLFIIQKKLSLNKQKKENRQELRYIGKLMNAEQELQAKRKDYEYILATEYLNGYKEGLLSIVNPPPKPKSKIDKPVDLIQQLRENARTGYRLSLYFPLLLSLLFLGSCSSFSDDYNTKKTASKAYIFVDIAPETFGNILTKARPNLLENYEHIAVHWPNGRMDLEMEQGSQQVGQQSSLVAARDVLQKNKQQNEVKLLQFTDSLQRHYDISNRDLTVELFGNMLASASEKMRYDYQNKQLDFYLEQPMSHILTLTDSAIIAQARQDAQLLKQTLTLTTHHLDNAQANIYLSKLTITNELPAQEVLRKTGLYFRRLLHVFQIHLLEIEQYLV